MRGGEGHALVVRGEAGVGKTALLDYAAEQASECLVARAAGVQSEMELAFAGLHQLCAPMFNRLPALPEPQRDALATAFGLRGGAPPDRFVVGLGVLNLLSEVAERQPLVLLVDDVQWLDQASTQALAFAARRLLAESVAVVFALRTPGDEAELAGLPELDVAGLSDTDARALLYSAVRGRLDERVREQIVGETHGNPLALLELPRGLTAAELAGGFGLPAALPLTRADRGELPAPARAPAARDPPPAAARGRRAGGRSAAAVAGGGGAWASAPRPPSRPRPTACSSSAPRVQFRHPLLRSAVYRGAARAERQARPLRAGRGDRPRGRPRSPRLAPRAGRAGPRRRRGRRARALGRARAGPRRDRRRGRVPRARGRADAAIRAAGPSARCPRPS